VDEVGDVSSRTRSIRFPTATAGDQGQRDTEEDRAFGQAAPVREDEQQDHAAEDGQDDGLRGQSTPGEHAEGHPHVPSVDEAGQTGDDLVGLVEAQLVADETFVTWSKMITARAMATSARRTSGQAVAASAIVAAASICRRIRIERAGGRA